MTFYPYQGYLSIVQDSNPRPLHANEFAHLSTGRQETNVYLNKIGLNEMNERYINTRANRHRIDRLSTILFSNKSNPICAEF